MASPFEMKEEQVLITGGDGLLGSYFDFGTRVDQKDLDVTDLHMVMEVCKTHEPRIIVHLAGLTDLTVCEQQPARAYEVNSVGTYHVALAARAIGAKLVYVSTSGVFDGAKGGSYTEEDRPNPVNVYGHSKYLGELAASGVLDEYLIVRASWLFGGGKEKDNKFVGKMMAQMNSAEIKVVTDKYGSPTYAKDLAGAIRDLIKENKNGIVHAGEGRATRYEIAKEIVSITGSTASIVPVAPGDFPLAYMSGEDESVISSVPMRPWQEALCEYIETEWNASSNKTT